MQPEPIEPSTHTQNTNASETSTTPQYGFHPLPHPSPVLGDSLEHHHSESESPNDTVEDAGLRSRLRGLNIGEIYERPKPSFQLISEYENALSPSPPRKQSEGPGFKIVKKKGNRLDGPQLQNFPNGMPLCTTLPGQCLVSNYYQRSSHTSFLTFQQHPFPPYPLSPAVSTVS